MGGVIAFEMARQLQQQGQEIALLALIDSQAPLEQQVKQHPHDLLLYFARDLGLTHENLTMPLTQIFALAPMAQLRQVWKEVKSKSLVPADMTLLEFREIFEVFKGNANTVRSYQPGEYEGRITLFGAEEDQLNDFGEEFFARASADPLKGWDKLATEGVDLQVVPGDHFTMVREPHVKILAERLRSSIHETMQRIEYSLAAGG